MEITKDYVNNLFDVQGKVALITGATGGLGKAVAIGLAQAGCKVFATGRKADTLAPLVEEIKAAGGICEAAAGDPAVEEDVIKVVDACKEAFGGVDILVTSAGYNKPGPILDQPTEEWQTIQDANVRGTYLYCKYVGKVMVDAGKGGKVVLVSSTRGALGMANYTAYSPSKAAIDLMCKSLGCEWGQYGINVNAIAPTVFRTALTQWMFEDDAFYKNFLRRIPVGRLGEPEDFLGSVIFLSSKASDFMTGTTVYVDGGYTAG